MRYCAHIGRRMVSSLALVLTACASAQSARPSAVLVAPISSGDRLRVTHTSQCCTNPAIGIEYSLDSDTLVLQPEVGVQRFALARSSISGIERWHPGRRHLLAGALIGFVVVAVPASVISYQTNCGHCDGDWRPFGAVAGAILGGGAGLLAGMIVGSRRHSYWETIPLSLSKTSGQ